MGAALMPKRLKKFLISPIGGLLILSTCTFAWCAFQIIAPPPFGINTGWASSASGAECIGTDFEPMTVCICPRETTCIKDIKSLVFLAFARLSAYFDYPLYVMLFLSKAHNLRGILHRTFLREFLPLDDLHSLHVFAGKVVAIEVFWHSFWHLLRWGLAGDLRLLWQCSTGISGLISLILTPLITWPMLFTRLKVAIDFTTRKALHYLSVVWVISICFHAPASWIRYIMGIAAGIYACDWIYGFAKLYHATTLMFTRIGGAVEIVWEHPPDFNLDGGGYVYVCLPWISRMEWHAFSLIPHPSKPNHSCVCMAAVGDWTKKVHSALARPSSRPGWIYGPFPSPFSTATGYDHLIAIASGIGITPTISTILNLSRTRRVHLIWMCRDADLVEYYMKTIFTQIDDDAWRFIFYTGKRNLVLFERPTNPRVKVCFGRPDLEELIISLVDNTHHGREMPKKLLEGAAAAESKIYMKSPTPNFSNLLERAMVSYSVTEMYELALTLTVSVDGLSLSAQKVSPKGFVAMMRVLCNIEGSFPDEEELGPYFKAVVISDEGALDHHDFARLIQVLIGSAGSVSPWSRCSRNWLDGSRHGLDSSRHGLDGSRHGLDSSRHGLDGSRHGLDGSATPTVKTSALHWLREEEMRAFCQAGDPEPPAAVASNPAESKSIPISRDIFEAFNEVAPWRALKHQPSSLKDLHLKASSLKASKIAQSEERKERINSWQLMYCGGAQAVIKSLQEIHEKYKMPLKIESFEW
jgi:predicted ferric reductase